MSRRDAQTVPLRLATLGTLLLLVAFVAGCEVGDEPTVPDKAASPPAGCQADTPKVPAPEAIAIYVGDDDDDGDDEEVDQGGVGDTLSAADATTAATTSTVFPDECNDLPRLIDSLRGGDDADDTAFKPSQPERWATLRDAAWADTPAVHPAAYGDGRRCDIDRVSAAELTPEAFREAYLEQRPVILVNATNWTTFAAMTAKRVLLYCFGDFDVTLSTANKNSYQKTETTFRHYVRALMEPQSLSASGVGTKYFFGDNRHGEWQALFSHYIQPSSYIWSKHASLSFGVGGSGSGVPFHTHGHVFAEVFHGAKRWFLQRPGPEPRFDPDESSLRWTTYVRPTFSAAEEADILDCVCRPGDLLYIPSFWHHSTLNLGDTVFMSTFV